MTAIRVENLERRYGFARVLARIDLTVEQGEHVAITGPNGSGKTTLLRVLAGLLRPTSGTVRLLDGTPSDPRVRRRVGVIMHAPSLYARMTASENIRFWGRLYAATDSEARGRELLARLGLDPDDERPVSSYSQGMRQRVSVARALCIDPEIVLADEPLAALDEPGSDLVSRLIGEGRTLVTATHDASLFPATRRFELRYGSLTDIR